MIKFKELNNGLKIAVEEMPSVSSVALGIWIGVGGRYEQKKISGISHFIEHMVFKGTKTRTCQQIKEEIEGIGGYLNAFTGEEFTCYYTKIIADEYSNALAVLADMVNDPLFGPKDIEQEKGVVIEEIRMYDDLPMHLVHDILNTILWPNHALGFFLTGSEKTVTSLTKNDLEKYKNDYYTPNNMVLAAAGNIKYEHLVEQAEKIFSLKEKKITEKFKMFDQPQKGAQLKIVSKKTEQTHLAIGLKAYSRHHPDRYALGILNVILGGNMSSRLFKEIREERGLAYSIHSSVAKYQDVGTFEISAGIDNLKVQEALKVILQELYKIKTKGITLDELQRAKKYYIGSFLMEIEKASERMIFTGENVLMREYKNIQTSEEIVRTIEQITIDDVARVALEVIQNNGLNMAMIGPVKDEEKIKEIFNI